MNHCQHSCECKHENIKYCARCDTAYCVDCRREWCKKYSYTGYNTYPWTYTTIGTAASSSIYAATDGTVTNSCEH